MYVDGFVLVVPKRNIPAYRRMAKKAGKLWRKHGALDYKECVGDDMSPKMGGMKCLRFPRVAKARPGETVVFSYIVYKSRAHRDRVNAKVMKDPAMSPEAWKDVAMPFDPKRVAYGGFRVLVDGKR